MTVILITGGVRSGKSRHAETVALSLAAARNNKPIYIATAEALDGEMRERIAIHRARREQRWQDIEAPLELSDALIRTDGRAPRLVDCLTLWLSNLMHADMDWHAQAATLCETLRAQTSPVLLVTNEVGFGIVPENALARRFRDNAGLLNQMVAQAADEVTLMVAGLPMKVK